MSTSSFGDLPVGVPPGLMRSAISSGVRVAPGWRAVWHCCASGFVDIAPLSGSCSVVAVGSLASDRPHDPDAARAAMRLVLRDQALVEGHDPVAMLHRTDAAMAGAGLGRLDGLILLGRAVPGPYSVTGAGHPRPLLVDPGGLTFPLAGCVAVDDGWTVVLGAGDGPAPFPAVVGAVDVQAAMSLFDRSPPVGFPSLRRTLVAISMAA